MSQEQVRQLVEDLLQSKSAEMVRMNQRISELEKLTRDQKKLIQQLQASKSTNQRAENNTNETQVPVTTLEKPNNRWLLFSFRARQQRLKITPVNIVDLKLADSLIPPHKLKTVPIKYFMSVWLSWIWTESFTKGILQLV